MRKLGQTIAALARYRRHWSTLLQTTAAKRGARRPAPARTISTELTGFGSNPGALAHVHLCAEEISRRRRRWSSCCTAARNRPRATISAPAGRRSRSATASCCCFRSRRAANNPKTCFNWFLPGDTARDRGEALSIRQMIEKTIGAHGIDRGRVFITGLSAGGAMAAAMLADLSGGVRRRRDHRGPALRHAPATCSRRSRACSRGGRAPRRNGAIWCGARRRIAGRGRASRSGTAIADATVKPMNADAPDRAMDRRARDRRRRRSRTRSTAIRARSGAATASMSIESYTITGMAHGTPLATGDAWAAKPGRSCSKLGFRRRITSRSSSA